MFLLSCALTENISFANIHILSNHCPEWSSGLFCFKMADTTITSKKAITLTLPTPQSVLFDIKEKLAILLSRTTSFAYSVYNPLRKSPSEFSGSKASFSFPKFSFNNFNKRKMFKIGVPILVGVVAIIGVVGLVKLLPNAKSTSTSGSNVQVPGALSAVELNRSLNFPLRDDKGEEVGKFSFSIENAELRKQIIVQGQRATAISGRVFLVLNLKITNSLEKTIQLNTRDYIRINVASKSDEQLAPDIHNDPVEVQAISTKYTRVGIAIDEADAKKTIHLKIGEIDGDKQNIDLNFKY